MERRNNFECQTVKTNTIKNNPNNPRIIKDDKFKKLVNSVKEFPKMLEIRPIVVDDNMIVLGGNMRLKACIEAGLKEVPIIKASNLTEYEQKQFIIKDNVSGGEWDWEILANEWDVDCIEEWGLDIPIFPEDTDLEAEEDDYTEEPPEEPVTVLGDLYELNGHRVHCASSTDKECVDKLMDGKKANMIFTDPPYGVSYTGGHNSKQRTGIIADELKGEDLSSLFEDSINTACLISEDNAPFYIWYAGGKSMETYEGLSKTPIKVRAVICWYKVKSGFGAFMSQYIPNYEPCIYGHKEGKSIQWFGSTDEKTVWELKKDQVNGFHPTQKPIELPTRAINNSSLKGQIIYDCFLGGGSTLLASEQSNRLCYGQELDPKYCDVIVKRWVKYMTEKDKPFTIKKNGVDISSEEWIKTIKP